MRLTIFAKTLRSREGKPFKVYLTRLKKTTGEEDTCRVMFREGIQIPPSFPVIVDVEKKNAQLSSKHYLDDSGQEHKTLTLWVDAYTPTGEEYIDHSLDEYI